MEFLKNKKLKPSSKNWMLRHINDQYVHKAKSMQYRSRAAFKLIEIEEKYKIFSKKPHINILELGSAPGGWSQIIVEKTKDAKIMCVDLLNMQQIDGVYFVVGDFCDLRVKKQITDFFINGDVSVLTEDSINLNDCSENADTISGDTDIVNLNETDIDLEYEEYLRDLNNSTLGYLTSNQIESRNSVIDLLLSDIAPSMTGNRSVDFSRIHMIARMIVDFAEENLKTGGTLVLKYFHTGNNEIITKLKKLFSSVRIFKPNSSRAESSEIYMICMNMKM